MDIISRMRREYRDIRDIRRGVEILEKEKKKKNRFQVNDKSSPCFEDEIETKGANIFSDFPKKIGERDLFMKISRVISDVVVFVERVQ